MRETIINAAVELAGYYAEDANEYTRHGHSPTAAVRARSAKGRRFLVRIKAR